jgi:hypothetical protein
MLKNVAWLFCTFSLIFFVLLPSGAYSEVIQLRIPFVLDTPEQMPYYYELLNTAIREAGHTPRLIVRKLPHLRAKMMLKRGEISIFWMVESAQRNQEFIPIEVGITNGLIGKRILFIKKGDQPLYDHVKTLEDFRRLNLVGGMGKDWFDVKVWEANGLRYKEQSGNWQAIFKKIPAGRDFNYCSRGLNEIVVEAKQYPELEIERKLVLIYDLDFRFYLSKEGPNAGAEYKDILKSAMKKAQESGLIDRLVRKYWVNDFETLHYDERIKIYLETPK